MSSAYYIPVHIDAVHVGIFSSYIGNWQNYVQDIL